MKMLVLSLLAVTAAASSPLVVAMHANPGGASGSRSSLFNAADTNHDGMLSRSEVPEAWADLRTHFDAVDLDHNLRLSEPEFNLYLRALVSTNWNGVRTGSSTFPVSDRRPPSPKEHLPSQ